MQETKQSRKQELQAYKRQQILNAAASLFRQNGLEGTTMRAIAKEAGYSTGASYAYFQSKEEIYSELLFKSLLNLTNHVKEASSNAVGRENKIISAFTAYYNYYDTHPFDLQLGLHLFSSGEVKRQGFSSETNKLLNGRLMSLLGYLANCLHKNSNASAELAQQETLDAISYVTGALILKETGRLSLFGADSKEMIDRYVHVMLQRIQNQ
ncbi:TetR/AcrR family transcriptional regulator [Sneathiella glossodoripedis]|uniref:TetR/AcrR family transcriptional regulator n=1 Tax=Sneathiella glossodoripedis TaxID=418853 RepID=UPI00046ECBFA|nr:TetR/AcrR family transcriptional regulator [Sneathiella glossodoripedis]